MSSTQHESVSPPSLKRIVPSEIPALFVKHGVKPAFGHFITFGRFITTDYDGDKDFLCGCLDGLLAIDLMGGTEQALCLRSTRRMPHPIERFVAETGDYHPLYVSGLSAGWEDDWIYEGMSEEWRIGYDDGEAAREACYAAGLIT